MPRHRDAKIREFAKAWINGPLPAALMADLADLVEDDDYPPEKRAHHIVWQALRYGMGDTYHDDGGE